LQRGSRNNVTFLLGAARYNRSSTMANATYEHMWREAMGDLNEQLNVEGVEDHDGPGGLVSESQRTVSRLSFVKVFF
jgi:hypothetical protein